MALAEALDAPGQRAGGVTGVVQGALIECLAEDLLQAELDQAATGTG